MFWIVFYNDANNTFNVAGPVKSDVNTTNFTSELIHYGLQVRMQCLKVSEFPTKPNAITQIANSLNRELDENLNWLKD